MTDAHRSLSCMRRQRERIPVAPVSAIERPNPHRLGAARLTTLHPHIVEVGRSDRDGRVGGVVGVAGRPEIAAVGRRPAVPKLILGGRIAISVGVRHPACDLRPLIGLQTVVSNRRDRRRVRLCRERE